MFKKKKAKSHLAMKIESKGLDQVTTEVVGGLMRQLSGSGYMDPYSLLSHKSGIVRFQSAMCSSSCYFPLAGKIANKDKK